MGISGRIARFFQDSQLTPLAALLAVLAGVRAGERVAMEPVKAGMATASR